MALQASENKSTPRPVHRADRWEQEVSDWLEAEAARRTMESRLVRARDRATEGASAEAIYSTLEALGDLRTLGPRVTVADVLHEAVAHYRRYVAPSG